MFPRTLLLATKIKLLGLLAGILLVLLTLIAIVMAFFNEKREEALAAIPVYKALQHSPDRAAVLARERNWEIVDTGRAEEMMAAAVPVVLNKQFEQSFYSGNILMYYVDSDLLYVFTVNGDRVCMRDPNPPRAVYVYVVGSAALLLVMLFALFRFVQASLSPIRQLEAEIAHYRLHDVLPKTPRIVRDDEMGRAAETFYALVASNDALKAQRTLFTRSIVHELKTPLMQNRLLAAHAQMPASLSHRLEESVARQNALLDELLELESFLRGQIRSHPTRFYLIDLVEDVLEHLDCKRTIAVDIGGEEVYGDYRLCFLIIKNLVDNACRYGATGSEVRLHAGEEGMLCIENRAAPFKLPVETYFKPFKRGPEGEGMGLGLYIVKELTEQLGYDFSYAYEAYRHIFCVGLVSGTSGRHA